MSYTKDRDFFMIEASKADIPADVARKLLRYATTLHRIAEAQCNGDWPYNGNRDRPHHKGSCSCAFVDHPEGDSCEQELAIRFYWDSRYTTCPKCEASGVAKSAMRKGVCPDCRTKALVAKTLRDIFDDGPESCKPHFNGDPRGAVLTLETPRHPWADCGPYGLAVPVRG